MSPTQIVHQQGLSHEENFGLDAVAQHNAAVASTEQFPQYHEDSKGLGIYHDAFAPYPDEPSYVHNPPTPRSNTASEGIRTRSGRSTRGRTDSPFSTSNRISKSPATRTRKDKKSKLDKSKTPKLTAPLSVLTKDMSVPLKDMDEWVNRPASLRRAEVEKRNGYVTRPMNSFMLYRSAYAERTKAWCVQNNHQVVSSVSGESWPMEPQEVRDQFNEWAKIERANHAAAHPEYKFSPSKSTKKRGRGEFSDDEEDPSDLDADPDGEYHAGGRNVRQRRHGPQQQQEQMPMNNTYGFESHPYYGHQVSGYEASQYQYVNPGRPLPSNIAYDANGVPYNPQTGSYIQQQTYQHPQYPYVQDVRGVRIPTPNSMAGNMAAPPQQQHGVGGFGLPGGQAMVGEDIFSSSRTSTPAINGYGTHYGQQQQQQQMYSHTQRPQQYTPQQSYQQLPAYQHPAPPPPVSQAYAEHQAYLQAASQPQTAIDPSLEAELAGQSENHFESAIGDLTAAGELVGLDYYQDAAEPNGNLSSGWVEGEVL
ncbi:hypothetical protein KC330_g1346 [Hortaea werneckii]|nr:hypothetical protein KC330_g1346 [Hortaea werneckii]